MRFDRESGIYLKSGILDGHTAATLAKGMADEFRENDFLPVDGFSTLIRIPPLCRALRRQLQDRELLLLGPISAHGLCTTDLPRESDRHSGLSPISPAEALPSGNSRNGILQHPCPCQPGPRLAHLCRLQVDQTASANQSPLRHFRKMR